jgi:hypothetical protein
MMIDDRLLTDDDDKIQFYAMRGAIVSIIQYSILVCFVER